MANQLATIGRKKYVSQSALESILQALSRQELSLQASSRRSIKRARDHDLAFDTPHGKLYNLMEVMIESVGDKNKLLEQKLPVLNMKAFLWHSVSTSPGFAAFMQRRLLEHPSRADRHWCLSLYLDEITPGNPLKPSNTRKVWAFYVSFEEFGSEARCQEGMWFTLCLARSSVVSRMKGGVSELTHLLMQSLRQQLDGGCMLTFQRSRDEVDRLFFFASLNTVVGDEAALKSAFDVKGASGVCPCPLCSNVVSRHSGLEDHDSSGSLVPIQETDAGKFRARSDQDLWTAHHLLASSHGTTSKAAFEQLEKSLGVNYNPLGVLANMTAPLVSSWMYDWLHIYLVHGLFNVELGLLLPLLYNAGISFTALLAFMQGMRWPKHWQSRRNERPCKPFQKKHDGNAAFNCPASQGLSAYPLLQDFSSSHGCSTHEPTVEERDPFVFEAVHGAGPPTADQPWGACAAARAATCCCGAQRSL